jgi:hypothetical protein
MTLIAEFMTTEQKLDWMEDNLNNVEREKLRKAIGDVYIDKFDEPLKAAVSVNNVIDKVFEENFEQQ